MKAEHIADFETAEELTVVEQPKKKRKKQGRRTTTNRALVERNRVTNELNHCTEPYSLALALGVDRITLLEWGTKSRIGQPHSRIIKRVKALITSNTILKGADGSLNPVYAMFLLNNSSQGFSNNTRLEVAQTPTEQIDAPKLDDVIEIYDSKDTSDT